MSEIGAISDMSEQQLVGKTAFVTGGTAGIGLAVARAYTRAGAEVVIGGRRDDGEEIARAAGCRFVALDVGNELDVRRALAAAEQLVGPLDVLVLNAGIAQPVVSLEALAGDDARSVVEIDLLGVVWGLKYGAAHLRDGASVILTSSIAAELGTLTEGVYGAAKAGVVALARSAAIELGPRGVRVNAVRPGPTATEMNHMPDALFRLITPLGRKGQVEDLVGVYVFFASDASRYITGQALNVDGGLTAGITPGVLRAVAAKVWKDEERAAATVGAES
jgi:NAD(P)-dependent dehydrogenase (short-subunit alcohol dehydrogenase family)